MTDRETLISVLAEVLPYSHGCPEYITRAKAEMIADHLLANGVVVREKGEWEITRDDYDNELMRCPVCHAEMYDGENDTVDSTPNFCPNCGADMRIEEQNRAREVESV